MSRGEIVRVLALALVALTALGFAVDRSDDGGQTWRELGRVRWPVLRASCGTSQDAGF